MKHSNSVVVQAAAGMGRTNVILMLCRSLTQNSEKVTVVLANDMLLEQFLEKDLYLDDLPEI